MEIYVKSQISFTHKTLGEIKFQKGYYYYIGSAQKDLTQRVKRHLRKTKKLHWHIDYLTTHAKARIKNTYLIPNKNKDEECKLVNNLEQLLSCKHIIKGFGNSDCNTCTSHLLFSQKEIAYNHFSALYQSTVLFIPSSKDIC